MKTTLVIYKSNDIYELPVKLCDTIEQASKWIGCTRQALYKSLHTNGKMSANGYSLDLVILNKEV